jgi:uncharacterized RDD family membrane protein YckC
MFFIIGGDGKEYGPVPPDQIHNWIANGRANLDTRAKLQGTEEWKRLGDFTEFGGSGFETPPQLVGGTAAYASPLSAVPSAAALSDEPADRGVRLAARGIDWVISMLACLPGLVVMGPTFFRAVVAAAQGGRMEMEDFNTGAIILGGLLLFILGLGVAIVQIVMLSMRGQTIGKRIVGIKIVRFLDGSDAGFVNAWLLRSFVVGLITMFLNFLLWMGYIFTIVDMCFIFRQDQRCLHDLIAGTRVVKVKKP